MRLVITFIGLFVSLTVGVQTFFQMSLTQKFKDAVSGAAVNVTALYTGMRYRVLHCERVETKYGVAVRVTLREADDNVFMEFLQQYYGGTITDGDMATINDRKILYYLRKRRARPPITLLQMDVY